MNHEDDRRRFFVDPPPEPRFAFTGLHGAALYFDDFPAAVGFYERVLGPPAYVQGEGTRSWRMGDTWLTLLKGGSGSPGNVELLVVMKTPAEAERLQAAFVEAGGKGEPPSDQVMHEPVRYCPVTDSFGTDLLIICPLEHRP